MNITAGPIPGWAKWLVGWLYMCFRSMLPPPSTYGPQARPIRALLEGTENAIVEANPAADQKAKELARQLREESQRQLNSITVTGALIGGVISSAFTWPAMESSSWPVKGCFYAGLILALGAVATASQQAIILSRVATGPNEAIAMCKLFIKELDHGRLPAAGRDDRFVPGAWQLYIWKIPVMLLDTSIWCSAAGVMVLIWDGGRAVDFAISKGETKIIIITMLVLFYVVLSNVISGTFLDSRVT